MAKKTKKSIVRLKCKECSNLNYTIYKPKNLKEKLNVKKFCSTCKAHTDHVETKL